MVRRFLASTCAVVGLLIASGGLLAGAQTPPASRTLSLDVWVRDAQGQVVANLTPGDFVVQVDGQQRRVTAARFVEFAAAGSPGIAPGAAGSTPQPGRALALVVDDLSFDGDEGAPLREAAARWVAQLRESDRVAVVRPASRTGRVEAGDPSDAAAGVRVAAAVQEPSAVGGQDAAFLMERRSIEQMEAIAKAVSWLAAESGPRVLVVLSKGMVMSPSATRYLSPSFRVARDAGISVHLVAPAAPGPSTPTGAGWSSVPADGPRLAGSGFDQLAAGMGGRVVRAQDTGDAAFAGIQRAVSGIYRLAVDVPPAALLLPTLPVTVSGRPAGLAVRTGALAVTPARTSALRTPADRTRDILVGMEVAGDITFHAVTSLSRETSSTDQLQLTISLVVPQDLPTPVRVTFGLLDETGTVRFSTIDVPDADSGPRRASAAIAVAPGWHRLTLVAEDGTQRLGSLSHAVFAKLRTVGGWTVAEPRVLWRADANTWQMLGGEALPEDAVVAASVFDLYPDASGREPPPLTLRLENEAGRDVATQTLTPMSVGQGWRYSSEVRLDGLAPDEYVFRLDTTSLGDGARSLALRFRKATPAADTSPAAAPPLPPLPSAADLLNLFRAGVRDNWPRFTSGDLLVPDLLSPQVKALAGSRPLPPALATATGDDWWTALRILSKQSGATGLAARGLIALRDGDSRAAESHLRDAVAASPSSIPLRRLLGIAYAASGRDDAAAGVWSLAPADSTADPRWGLAFAEALGRTGDYRAALDQLRQVPGDPTGGRAHRIIESLIVIGLMDEALAALTAWEAGEGREQPAARPTFYLVALRYAAALQPSADAAAIDAFRLLADRYVTARGEYADVVAPWLHSVAALQAK